MSEEAGNAIDIRTLSDHDGQESSHSVLWESFRDDTVGATDHCLPEQ